MKSIFPLYSIQPTDIFPQLGEIPDQPKKLTVRGSLDGISSNLLTIVGSRRYTAYGQQACEHIINGLRGAPITIVSGLALGIDTIAHTAALDTGLTTLAFPGSGLDEGVLYPRSNMNLATRIIESGGALLSEYEPDFKATKWSFPKRNRLMAGISQAVLVIEATRPSGTLITSRLATEYNKDVLAVPGSIFQSTSDGTNFLIRQGAQPITCAQDILEYFNIDSQPQLFDTSALTIDEQHIYTVLINPITRSDIIQRCSLSQSTVNTLLTKMELKGIIIERVGVYHKV